MKKTLSKLKKVDLRDVWGHEALDFPNRKILRKNILIGFMKKPSYSKKYLVNTLRSLKIVFMQNSTANLIDEIFGKPEIKHGLDVFEKASTEQEFPKNCHFKTCP